MPRVIHFEIPADDPQRAATFYERVFGWQFQKWDGLMEYWMVNTGPDDQPGISGAMVRRQQPGASTTNVVDVASVDEVAASIEAAGGSIVVPKMAVPGVGWAAYFADSEQNIFGVMQADTSAG